MPKIQASYRLILKDKKGNVLKKTKWKKTKSFVIAFLQHIDVLFNHAYTVTGTIVAITDTVNTARNIRAATQDVNAILAVFAPDNTSSYGIVVGSGTTTPTNSDYALETQIAHGTGAGQLDYGAHSRTASAIVGSNIDYIISRDFYNGSGNTVTVKEIGVYCSSIDTISTPRNFCIIRDVLAASQDVLDTQTLTVQYTIRTTV